MARLLPPNLKLVDDADDRYLPSMITMHVRSFYPVNPYSKACFPDTPLVRDWWRKVHLQGVEDPTSKMICVVDTSREDYAISLCRIRLAEADEDMSSGWSETELCEDINRDMYLAMVSPMGGGRARLMGGRKHYLVEFVATDHDYKNKGVGAAMLQHAVDLADEAGVEMFVEANGAAEGFYKRFGFETKDKERMPGEYDYWECFMVRPAKNQ